MLRKYDAAGFLQWASPASGANTQPSIMGDHVYSNSESGQIQKFDKSTGVQVIGSGFPISTGSSWSALTTVNGKIYHKADILYAYDADYGTLLWSEYAGGDGTYYGSPAVSGGVVYVYGYDAKLYAFDENTGGILAGFPSVSLNSATGITGRNWGSPAIAGDKIFIGAGTTQELKVLGAAGTAQAGQVLAEYLTFSTDFQGFDLCSPVVSDGWVLAMLDGGGLYAFYGGDDPHSGALVINDDESCTESQGVTLALDNNDNPDVVEMRISEDPFFTGAMWEPYSETTTWTLSAGFGTKTVYAQLKDTFGQLSNVFTDQIDYLESCGVGVVPVFVDIKPGSCPNPLNVNVKDKGVLPVAVLGTMDFDVTTIDPSTIKLTREPVDCFVQPIRWSCEDVATPFEEELCDCHDLNGDGYMDLTLKFVTQEVVSCLALEELAGKTIPLTLTGNLKEENSGTPIIGEDCVWIK
ncbi:MAG: PQQ-like beta-propeller repeat protein [Deltaproteobacteria bacterium]|nr:PQQ-like beta-propeller repeat protein [Deltaproteobacteria bacterium]